LRAGWRGLIVARSCVIPPATLIVCALAWAYVRLGTLRQAQAILYGIKPVIIAIVVIALWELTRTAVKSAWLGALGGAALLTVALGVNEILVLAAAGIVPCVVGAASRRGRRGSPAERAAAAVLASALAKDGSAATGAALLTVGATAVALGKLFLVFLKAGAFLFGSGYVLLAFLWADLVERLGWLTEKQLLDAIAVVSGALMVRTGINSAWLILAGGVIGLVVGG
jgi:chromate transporter